MSCTHYDSTQPNQDYAQNKINHFKNKIANLIIERNELDGEIKYNETVLLNLEQSNKDNRLVIPQTGSGVRVKIVPEIILNNNQNNY